MDIGETGRRLDISGVLSQDRTVALLSCFQPASPGTHLCLTQSGVAIG